MTPIILQRQNCTI